MIINLIINLLLLFSSSSSYRDIVIALWSKNSSNKSPTLKTNILL